MDEAQFWEVIQRVNDRAGVDMDRKCALLQQDIAELSKDHALAFAALFDTMMDRAYAWPLWGAAYIVHGGCGDDTFSDFRACLISRGRACFERAVADPDSLADEAFDDDAWFYEGYQYAVSNGVKAAAGTRPGRRMPAQPSGMPWREHDLANLFPKLAAKFPHHVG